MSIHCINISSTPISLRYHRLHPEYILTRIEKLGRAYNLRILLILCDVVRPFHCILSLILIPYIRSPNIRSPFEN